MNKKQAFWAALWDGLSAPGAVWTAPPAYPCLRGSDMDRLRGDWQRVGDDFRKVMNGEQARNLQAGK